jgi:hypothetical protein
MQGSVSLEKLRVKILDLKDLSVEVGPTRDGTINYVIANTSGITLTGFEVQKELPSAPTIGGFAVSGVARFSYSHADKSLGINGTLQLTSQEQSGKVALKNVQAGLDFSMTFNPFKVHTLGFSVGGDFQIFDLEVSTNPQQPLNFHYNFDEDQFEVGGDLTIKLRGNSIETNLVYNNGPGIIIQGGQLQQLGALITADLHLFGAEVATVA